MQEVSLLFFSVKLRFLAKEAINRGDADALGEEGGAEGYAE